MKQECIPFRVNLFLFYKAESKADLSSYSDQLKTWMVGVRFPVESRNNLLLHVVQTGSGPTQIPIQWVRGAHSAGIRRQRQEADHLPPSNAEETIMELHLHSMELN
jgi:hypothetical protein